MRLESAKTMIHKYAQSEEIPEDQKVPLSVSVQEFLNDTQKVEIDFNDLVKGIQY